MTDEARSSEQEWAPPGPGVSAVADAIEPHAIAESRHRILNLFTERKLRLLAEVAGVRAGTRILDLACGKGELLCRWAAEFGAAGHGIDLWPPFITAAEERALELEVSDRVSFAHGDAADHGDSTASYDIGSCMGATWVGDGVAGTIDLLRPAVRLGGEVIIGEPYWIDTPPDEAFDALGFQPDEFTSLTGLLKRFESADAELVEMVIADPDDGDRYVAAQWRTTSDWLHDNPQHPRQAQMAEFLTRTRHSYLTYQRRYLGWGAFVLKLR